MNIDLKLLFNEVPDKYSQENFKRIQKAFQKLIVEISKGVSSGDKIIIQPLDGSVPITGTIEPSEAGAFSLGSPTKPLDTVHANELSISGNSLYMDGKKVLHLTPEGAVNIVSDVAVLANLKPILAFAFKVDTYIIPTQIVNGNQVVLTHVPIENSERIVLNGLELTKGEDFDYTIWQNVVTFTENVLTTDGHVKAAYNY